MSCITFQRRLRGCINLSLSLAKNPGCIHHHLLPSLPWCLGWQMFSLVVSLLFSCVNSIGWVMLSRGVGFIPYTFSCVAFWAELPFDRLVSNHQFAAFFLGWTFCSLITWSCRGFCSCIWLQFHFVTCFEVLDCFWLMVNLCLQCNNLIVGVTALPLAEILEACQGWPWQVVAS